MLIPIERATVLSFLILLILAILVGWLWLRTWYFRLQVVGITLNPLHRNPEYFGEQPEQFHPERYLEAESVTVGATTNSEAQNGCPLKRFFPPHRQNNNRQTKAGIYFPLTFGDGARKCLAEHFAMYEMKVALAVLLSHFDFQPAPNFKAELELGKFGLFLTTFPKDGVKTIITPRNC